MAEHRTTRRKFLSGVGGAAALSGAQPPAPPRKPGGAKPSPATSAYPRVFTGRKLRMIAFPLGGIGTGTISLGGRGQLRDWEIFNRPDKGNAPGYGFFSIWARAGGKTVARVLESRIQPPYEVNYRGLGFANAPGLPRLRDAVFEGDYPFARIRFRDEKLPVEVRLEAFTPLVPLDVDASSLPVAVLRYTVANPGAAPATVSVAYSQENPVGTRGNQCAFQEEDSLAGLLFSNPFLGNRDPLWGTFAVSVLREGNPKISYLKNWKGPHLRVWPVAFWDDFKADGELTETGEASGARIGSLCAQRVVAPKSEASFTFLLSWHFPNRTAARCGWRAPEGHENDLLGNYYCTQFQDAWASARHAGQHLEQLETRTRAFVRSTRETSLPPVVIEAAMANLSTLRTNTCFRTADGNFYGFEGCADQAGCCMGSCTHVWNYEHATSLLFPSLSRSMRESEFGYNTDEKGCMSFRQILPDGIERLGKAAADGQMGCLVKLYLDWKLSGDTDWLRKLWPQARKALEFAWIPNGWDADRDGVMEGVQHNTYDVEFFGPNPMCGVWYLAALRACEEMARALGEAADAQEYRRLFENGSKWIDANLFNGSYYEQKVRPYPPDRIPRSLVSNMAVLASAATAPAFQVGDGCLIDQLVGQYAAHVAGLGYVLEPRHVSQAIASVYRNNFRSSLTEHESVQRVYALNDEAAMLICSFPKGNRPRYPFWFFSETMTGFEYQAAIHLIYEGMPREGLRVIEAIRERYDGERRNPWNEAECGHHYSRAMASWAAIPALAGFRYSGVEKTISFAPPEPKKLLRTFWSTGAAWGRFSRSASKTVLEVVEGSLGIETLELPAAGPGRFRATLAGTEVACSRRDENGRLHLKFEPEVRIQAGQTLEIRAKTGENNI